MNLIRVILTTLYALAVVHVGAIYLPYHDDHNLTERHLGERTEFLKIPLLDERASAVTSGYVWQDYYEIHQFDQVGTINGVSQRSAWESMLHTSVIHCMAILLPAKMAFETEIAAAGNGLPTNPSILRYGPTDILSGTWLPVARDFVQRWLDVLGWTPLGGVNTRAQCLPNIGKLQFWFNDPPDDVKTPQPGEGCAQVPQLLAYYFFANDGHKNGIVFCPRFFLTYKSLDAVDASQFGPAIEFGDVFPTLQPTYFTAKVLLHELMHYDDVYKDFFRTAFGQTADDGPIDDILLRDPQGQVWAAYGAFMATKARDSSWDWMTSEQVPQVIPRGNARNTLFNAENWVYMLLELYYKTKYALPDWRDPADSRRFGIPFPPPAPAPAPAPVPAPAPPAVAMDRVVKLAAASESSSTAQAENSNIIYYHQMPVTKVPNHEGSFSIPTYAPGCPLCQSQSNGASTISAGT